MGHIMLIGFIGFFLVYAIAHYLITLDKRNLFATILVMALPFVGLYYDVLAAFKPYMFFDDRPDYGECALIYVQTDRVPSRFELKKMKKA